MTHTTPDPSELEAQLGRISSSPGFARSRRLAGLLEYLVQETLEGRGERIKATSIAMDFYGRDETFDQQRDTIVRVEAGRLRRQLQNYYEGPGQTDPVRIEIPRGNYQPVIFFTDGEAMPGADLAPQWAANKDSQGGRLTGQAAKLGDKWGPAGLTLVVILALLFLWYLQYSASDQNESAVRLVGQTDDAAFEKPFLMVMPLTNLGMEEAGERLALGTAESLITNLAKLSGLSVMAHGSILGLDQQSGNTDLDSLRKRLGVTHILQGSVAQEKSVAIINMRLVETGGGRVIWAHRYSSSLEMPLAVQEDLALRIASELSVQIQPDERERLADLHSGSPEAWTLYRQGLVMLIPPNDVTRIETARALFQRARELAPGFAGGYAGESFSHSITLLFLKANAPQQELEEALRLAKQAVAEDADFAMGYATLSFAQVFAGEAQRALENARTAVKIQPGDAFAQFILGMNLIFVGQPEGAVEVLREALRLDPLESRTPYLNVLAIAQYAAGHYTQALEALEYNLGRGGPRGPHMDLFRCLTLAQLDRTAEARDLCQSVAKQYPDFPAQQWMGNWLSRTGGLQDSLRTLEELLEAQ